MGVEVDGVGNYVVGFVGDGEGVCLVFVVGDGEEFGFGGLDDVFGCVELYVVVVVFLDGGDEVVEGSGKVFGLMLVIVGCE